jgi:hypothetical protein
MMSEVHDGLCGAHQSAYRTLDVIRRRCWKITLSITKGVKIVRSLGIFKESQHQFLILLSSHGHSEDGV